MCTVPDGVSDAEAAALQPLASALLCVRDAGIGTGDVVFEAVGGDQSHATEGSDPLAQAYRAVRSGGTVVQVGNTVGDITVNPGRWRSKSVRRVNPTLDAGPLGPNTHSGELAGEPVASGRVSIDEYVTHEPRGLDPFERAVGITLNPEDHGAWGPAQIVVAG